MSGANTRNNQTARINKSSMGSSSLTRSMTRSINKPAKLPQNAATFHGLHDWHKALFEKMGWMVLAKAKGMTSKIAEYKKSIDHLIRSLKHVCCEYKNHNRKHDLNVLLMNAEVLKAAVAKTL